MRSHVADHFRKVRLKRGTGLAQLARQVGYRNINKGCRRINTFEQTGQVTDDLLMKLAEVLAIDADTVVELKRWDQQDWERWASEPIEPFLVVRIFAAAYCRKYAPNEITNLEQAEAWAAEIAGQLHKRVCLVWGHRAVVYFDSDGQIEQRTDGSTPPTMTVAGKPITMKLDETGSSWQPVSQR